MQLKQHEIAYGAVAGAAIGIAYQTATCWWANDYSNFTLPAVGAAAAIGAVAGILAFVVRGNT